MNVHDLAHSLARALKESPEYKEYAELKATISKNAELTELINDFQEKQMGLHTRQMAGEEIESDAMAQLQSLFQILQKDPLAARYVQAEMKFSVLVNDIYQILGEVIQVGE